MLNPLNYLKNISSATKMYLLPLILGALTVLSFAPWQIFVFALITPALLEALIIKLSPWRAGLACLCYGFGFFGAGISWVFLSIHDYSEAPLWAGLGITAGFVLILSALLWVLGFIYRRLLPNPASWQRVFGFTSLWVLLEAVRGWLFTGFPWLFLGYSLIDTPFVGYAPIIGVYGLSFIGVFYGMLALQLKTAGLALRVAVAILLVALPLGGQVLKGINWTFPMEQSYQVGAAQGNIPQDMKWDPSAARSHFSQYYQLSQSMNDADIIIWPEASLPFPLPMGQLYVDVLSDFAQAFHTTFVIGMIEELNSDAYTNSVRVVGDGEGQYNKHHLVPFGEYIPYYQLLGKTFDFLKLPKSFTVPGEKIQAPLKVKNWHVGTLICYEVVYPELSRSRAKNANVLLTVSNDTWFGHSLGPDQHFQMARMRAVEAGLPMIRVTNNGITGFIDTHGAVSLVAPRDMSGILKSTVQGYMGATPLTRIGHNIILLCIGLIFAAVYLFRR